MQDFDEILFQDYNKAPWTENDSKVLLVWNCSVGVLTAMILSLHLFYKKALPFFSTVKNSLPRTLARINWQPYKNLALTAKHISYFLIKKTTSTDKWITRAEYTTCKRPQKNEGHADAYFATIWPTGPSDRAGMKTSAIHTASNLFPNHKFLVFIISVLGNEPDR
jgi:hypothetical protein